MNRDLRHADRDTMIHPLLTKYGRYPHDFSYSKRLVDLMRMGDRDLDHLMKVYGCPAEWLGCRGNRGTWTGAWVRKHDRHPVSIDQLANLEILFNFLGAYHVADKLRQYRKDRSKNHVFNDPEFLIRRS